MGVKYGSTQSQAMWIEEASWGTEGTANSYFGRLKGYNFTFTDEKPEAYNLGERDVKQNLFGPFSVKGNTDFYLAADTAATDAGAIFKLVMGSVTGNGTAANAYTFPSSANSAGIRDLPSATIELGKNSTTDTNWTITGAMINSASISIAKEGLIEVSLDWIAKTVKIDSTIVSYTPPSTYVPFNAAITTFKRAGSSVGTVENASIKLEEGLVEGRGLNDRLLQTLLPGTQKITWEATVVMDSDLLTTMFADAYGQAVGSGPLNSAAGVDSGQTMSIECTDGATPERAYEFTLSNAVITEHSEGIEVGDNLSVIKFSGKARFLVITHNNQA
jgi:hypothetical protein